MDTSAYENPSIIDGLSFNQQMFDHFMAGGNGGGHSSGGSLLDVQPSKEGKDKIERCPNFSEVEKTQFIDLFEENKDVLLNNGRKPNLAEMKKEIWDKICLEMNATVSAQLPRTVNQLQTFWKNVSVRTKNKYKDLSPGEYDQLPPLTAKILVLADEASSAYNNSLNSGHNSDRKPAGGNRSSGGGPGRPSGSSGRKSQKQHHHQEPSTATPNSTNGPLEFAWKFQAAVNGGAASEKLDDSPYGAGGGDVRTIFNGNGFGHSKMTDYSRSSDSRATNNDDYENSALVMAVDEHSNDMLPISSNANGGFSYENCGDSTPEPVPSDSAFNEYLQQTFLNSKNFGVLNGVGNNGNGRHCSENSSSISNILNQQQQHLLSNGIKSAISSSNLKSQQNSKMINNNNNNQKIKNNNAPNGKRKFSWEKFSDVCEKRAKIREKARQIDMKNKALQTQIEANLAKKQKYDEQANYYRLKCLEMSVLMQKDGFIGGKQLAWFNKIT